MLAILDVTAPFFALVLCGFIAARMRMLPPNAVPALNTFVLYFALPCMLFRFAAGTAIGDIFNLPVFTAYALTGLTMLGGTALTMRAAGNSLRDAAFAGLSVAWSNWGYMGFALLPPLLGQAALAPLIGAGMADLLLVMSAALALASLQDSAADGKGGGAGAAFKAALSRVARNPLIWSTLFGAAVSAAHFKLPGPVSQFASLLGNSAGPVALFTIGITLYRPDTRPWRADVFSLTGAKLLLHPGLAFVVTLYLFGLSGIEVRTMTLMASLPVAGTVFLFAERQGGDAERIAASILMSTALSFFTFSGLCWMFGVKVAGA